MIAQLLALLIKSFFGSNLRRIAPPALPSPVEVFASAEDEEDSLDPVSPIPTTPATTPPPAPNILVPDPAHRDDHGPASAIARAMLRKGHAIFSDDRQPRNLNIVAIRTATPEFNRFRCRLVHFDRHEGEWSMRSWPITTLPGDRYTLTKLLNPAGVAILVPGQYRGIYTLAKHRGIYEALCQRNGPVRVYRDGNRNRVYDMVSSTIQSGNFGINVHATENPDDGISRNLADTIGAASAGCLVTARVTDFVEARKEWRQAKLYWGSAATVTLLDDDDLDDPGTIPHEAVEPQHSDKETWMPPTPHTLGIRNRNLLNVKQNPRNPWKYSTGADARGHTIFPNFPAGIRAGIITLRTYWTTHRLRTLSGICGRWAPSTDTHGSIPGASPNQPDLYAEFLGKRMGLLPGSALMLFTDTGQVRSPDQLHQIVAGMAAYENHPGVSVPRDVFDKAITLL
jgi:hypothetical protein